MDKIGAYNIFQNSLYEKTSVKKETAAEKSAAKKTNSVKKEQTSGVNQTKQVELSDKAKALLEELKKKYTNMDFMVADYETEEEAAEYLSRGTKEFSVLIDPDTLEEMAADEEVCNQYLTILDEASGNLQDMVEELGDDGSQVKRVGVTIHKDGTVSYFAELEKTTAKQKERIEKSREEKAEKAEKEEKKEKAEKQQEALHQTDWSKRKSTLVQADTIEELMEKIQNVNWDEVQETEVKQMGGKIDFTA